MTLRRILIYITIGLVVILGLLLIGVRITESNFVGSAESAKKFFEENQTTYELGAINYEGEEIDYFMTGQMGDSRSLVLFIHGAPGSWDAFKSYLVDKDLTASAQLISMTRPGYGFNANGKSTVSIAKQAEAALTILKRHPAEQVILVGHSYGGPIVGKLAADNPALIDGVLMIAPLNDPVSEPVRWYAYLCNLGFLRALLPSYIDVATDEKMAHASELKKIENDWNKISVPIIHYHGAQDNLAPFQPNIDFSIKHINPDYLELITEENADHFLVWNREEEIKKLIFELLDIETSD